MILPRHRIQTPIPPCIATAAPAAVRGQAWARRAVRLRHGRASRRVPVARRRLSPPLPPLLRGCVGCTRAMSRVTPRAAHVHHKPNPSTHKPARSQGRPHGLRRARGRGRGHGRGGGVAPGAARGAGGGLPRGYVFVLGDKPQSLVGGRVVDPVRSMFLILASHMLTNRSTHTPQTASSSTPPPRRTGSWSSPSVRSIASHA